MEKICNKSMNIVAENIIKMKELFPEIFCEDKIDFEKLKEVLGEYTEDKEERYSFNWKGKSKSIRLAQTSSTGTLRPCKEESKNWDNTNNLYIEGDNLEVLKLLQKSYNAKVKIIYIDPPYNTGNDFVYPDDFRDNIKNYLEITGQVDGEGRKLGTNSEASGRYHTDWLNMMYPRLRLARNLLSDDGVIFISINDNEMDNLKKICCEIFGEQNFVAQFPWQSRQSVQNDTDISSNHEYIIAYAKVRRQENRRLKESNVDIWFKHNSFVCLPLILDKDKFDNPDNDKRGLWKADPFDAPNIRPNLTYKINNPNTCKEYLPPSGRHWRTEQKSYEKLLADNRISFGKTDNSRPQLKVFYEEKKMFGSIDNTWWTGEKCGTSSQGTKEQIQLFGGFAPFDTPKPVKLLTKILSLVSLPQNNDIMLDFFSGSATTAHAVMKLNEEDGGNRKFIMVQIPKLCEKKSETYIKGYKNICEIGKGRIRRAGEKILKENKDREGIENLDIGFKVFKLDSSNIKKWNVDGENLEISIDDMIDNFVPNRTEEDIVYEIMLKYGIDLTYPLEIRKIGDKKIFSIGFGALFICLDNEITLEVVEGIVKFKDELKPEVTRVVFKDNGFQNDSVKTNAIHILRRNKIQEIMSI